MPRLVKKTKGLVPGQPKLPSNLSPEAKAEWERISAELAAANIRLTTAHRSILELAANLAADLLECRRVVKIDGEYVRSQTGIVAHPAVRRMDALGRDYIKVAAMLGLRCAVPGETKKAGKSLEEILDA